MANPQAQQQQRYKPRAQVYSAPGASHTAPDPTFSITNLHHQHHHHPPSAGGVTSDRAAAVTSATARATPTEPPPRPARGGAWAEAEPTSGHWAHSSNSNRHVSHTSLTPAKVAADLSVTNTHRPPSQGGVVPDQKSSSGSRAAADSRDQAPNSPDKVSVPVDNRSPSPGSMRRASSSTYGRSRASSSPAVRTPSAQAYGRSHHTSADGYGAHKHQSSSDGAAGSRPSSSLGDKGEGDKGQMMGMIPGYSISRLLGEGGFCQVRNDCCLPAAHL